MNNMVPVFPHCLVSLNQGTNYCYSSFRLLGCVAKITRAGQPFWSIKLADVSAVKDVLLFDACPSWDRFVMNSVITTELNFRSSVGLIVARGPQPLSLPSALAEPALFWKAIPISWVISDNVVQQFLQLLMSIQSSSLLSFITQVFWQPDVLEAFLTAPASLNYHHNYAGGLLQHSLEVAQICAGLPLKSQYDRDVLVTAALLHDIGKTKTMKGNMRRTPLGKLVDHDEMTLELCAPALRWLDTQDEKTAILLRHLWTCTSPGARYGYKAETYLAPALQLADRMSSQITMSA